MAIQTGGDWGIRKRGMVEWQQFLRDMNKKIGTESPALHAIAKKAIDIIKKRTNASTAVDGTAFKELATGLKRKLKQSGVMLKAMDYRINNRVITIFFHENNDAHIIAEVHQYGMISGRQGARFKMPRSNFFGLNQREIDILQKIMEKELMDFIRSQSIFLKF